MTIVFRPAVFHPDYEGYSASL